MPYPTTPVNLDDLPDYLAAPHRAEIASRAERDAEQAAEAAAAHRPPGLFSMARGLTRAVVAHAIDGGRKATPEVQAARKAACDACPLHLAANDACTSCGCGTVAALSFVGLDLALKRSWASSRCPDNPPRWDAV